MGIEKKQNSNQRKYRMPVLFLQGCIIGVGGILPGISGGVLCVIFGLYRPIIETLSNPVKNLKKYWHLIIPTAAGIGAGFIGLAGITSMFMEKNSAAAVCIFIGLIIGMIPDLWKDAGKEGRRVSSVLSMVVSFAVFTAFFCYLKFTEAINVECSIWWFLFCGTAWGLSIIVPGLSSSSILIFLGLYQPMLEGVSRLDPSVIFPLCTGILIVILTLSKGVNILYKRHYTLISHIIIGIVAATTVPIIPVSLPGSDAAAVNLICFVCGLAAALIFSRIIKTNSKNSQRRK
ncbi:MAG: DUF368 domain-containing protein [Bacillota bacterium]|nr:DUF368 domain-containing protein [Bacillota bacterium]